MVYIEFVLYGIYSIHTIANKLQFMQDKKSSAKIQVFS